MPEILEITPSHSKELLAPFASELFLTVAKQDQQEFRRQRQAEGIAAACDMPRQAFSRARAWLKQTDQRIT